MVEARKLKGHPTSPDTAETRYAFTRSNRRRKPPKTKWLIICRLAYGKVHIWEGPKGAGKTTSLGAIAAAVTGGNPLPGRRRRKKEGNVLWFQKEGGYQDEILPRVEANGGDPHAILWPHGEDEWECLDWRFPGHFKALEKAIVDHNVKLVIIENWERWLGKGITIKDLQGTGRVIDKFAQIARRTGCAIILARHVRKDANGDLRDHGIGNVSVGGTARFILRIDRHPTKTGVNVLYRVAGNLCPAQNTLLWQMKSYGEVAGVEWMGEEWLDEAQLLELSADESAKEEKQDCETWMRGMLRKQEQTAKLMVNRGSELFSKRTTYRTKAKLKVKSKRRYDKKGQAYLVWLALPAEKSPTPSPSQNGQHPGARPARGRGQPGSRK